MLLNDLVPDCGPDNEDELALLNLRRKIKKYACDAYEIPCFEGHFGCFKIEDICVFKLNTHNYLIPCRNGGHIQNCAKFECNLMFKCIDAYCIPWIYVCDGKWDCPSAEDELANNVCRSNDESICKGMYRCRFEKTTCIHIGSICDNNYDCPNNDDEMLCEFNTVFCPSKCGCLLKSITCSEISLETISQDYLSKYLSVFIINSNINLQEGNYFQRVHFLFLPQNNIDVICHLLHLKYLLLLQLRSNYIVEIHPNCFKDSIFLKTLDLGENIVTYLNAYSFHNLSYLIALNLSNNPLPFVPSKCFSHLISLKILFIQSFNKIDLNPFSRSVVNVIISSNYQISCVAPPDSVCTSYPPWYISCSALLPTNTLKLVYILVSILIVSSNVASLMTQIFKNRDKNFEIMVIGLNCSDSLCGFYICSIWISEVWLQRSHSVYLIDQSLWMSHSVCFTGSFLVLWFTISSQLLLIQISVTRCMAVVYPLEYKVMSLRSMLYKVTSLHLFSIGVSILLTMFYKTTGVQKCL